MAYVLPNFNLTCNVWSNPAGLMPPEVPEGDPRIADLPCALVYGRRTNVSSTGGTADPGVPLQAMNLLVGALTDIRGPQDDTATDVVECPAGTGRYYGVYFVDDIGKGYANEHRSASLLAIAGSWVAPYL